MSREIEELVIVGGGPAGLTAGIYAARAKLPVVLVERELPGGQAAIADRIENYPGFPQGIEGGQLMALFEQQARRWGVSLRQGNVTGVTAQEEGCWGLEIEGEAPLLARALIVATGAAPRPLGVKGERDFRGRGVSYCATCDAPLFEGADVAVVGGGDAAVQEACFLANYARRVTLIHRRRELRASPSLQERARSDPRLTILLETVVEEIRGRETVEQLGLRNVVTGQVTELAVEGVFIFVGRVPNTEFLRRLDGLGLTPEGYVVTDERLRTSLPGIFAAGDVRAGAFRQVITAAADGARAAREAEEYLQRFSVLSR